MIKNILNLKGTTLLTREQQKSITGNGSSSIRCTISELEAIYNGNPRNCIVIAEPQPIPGPCPPSICFGID